MTAFVGQTNPQLKVYISVVHQLKDIIQQNRLSSGDRLPSERELSERLGVGRSSVREAFRALELLGLIETRHGEGTFLRDFRDHHFVELLGMFILQQGQAEQDVTEMKDWIEYGSISRLFSTNDQAIDSLFDTLFDRFYNGELVTTQTLKDELIQLSGNRLIYKVWHVLHEFNATNKQLSPILDKNSIQEVKNALLTKDLAFIQAFCQTPNS